MTRPLVRRVTADGMIYIGAALPLERVMQAARVGAVLAAPVVWSAAESVRDPRQRAIVRGVALVMAAWNGWAWLQVRREIRGHQEYR